MSIKAFELYLLSVIKGKRRGVFPFFLRGFLWVLSLPFQLVVNLRNSFFDRGWLRCYTPPVPLVISVGNITTGGTGKTPATLMIAEEFQEEAQLAILSRGYRSQAEKSSLPLVLSKENGEMHPASFCGDEPYLLAHNLPKVHVIVGKDRFLSSKIAARMGAQVILLDDGMQHRGIARDFEVVVMDLLDPFGQGYFLPRGLLREGKKALSRADLIILNHLESVDQFEGVKRQISSATSAPVVGTKLEILGAYGLDDNSLTVEKGTKVGIFCGIAHPEYFRKTIDQLGLDVVSEWFFPDHDAIDLEKLIPFSKKCQEKGATLLLCTEKDRVKLTNVESCCLPIGWIKARLTVIEGLEHWNRFILRAKNKIKSKVRESL